MKKVMIACLATAALACSTFSASANQVEMPAKTASWLEILNYYRASSGLAPVTEDLQMSAAAQKHTNYLAKTDVKYLVNEFSNLHLENPASPYYDQSGQTYGAGDIAWTSTFSQHPIDQFMSAPFHAIGLLRQSLVKVGFGTAPVQAGAYFPGHQVTDLAVVAGTTSAPRTKNIFFPGANSTISINDFHSENPDPREACGADYKKFRGLPIFAALLVAPSIRTSAFLTTPHGKILSSSKEICVVTEHTLASSDPIYGASAKSIMATEHMIVIIPREPLTAGKYAVDIKQSNKADLKWRFTFADTFEKVENKVTIIYPRLDKSLFVGETVKIRLMSVDAGASSLIDGASTCTSVWHGEELWITDKKAGTCKVTVSGKASLDTAAFKKSFTLSFVTKKK